jgi:hypothetical protein
MEICKLHDNSIFLENVQNEMKCWSLHESFLLDAVVSVFVFYIDCTSFGDAHHKHCETEIEKWIGNQ